MLTVIHHIEDVQVVCFAIIFGLIAFQLRNDRFIRYVCLSYVLASAVSALDIAMHQPLSAFVRLAILVIISVRYALFAIAMAVFTRSTRRSAMTSFSAAAFTLALLFLPRLGFRESYAFAGDYALLAFQMALLAWVMLRAREVSTRVPRVLLAGLFLLSVGFRSIQTWIVLVPQTPNVLWWRDEAFFVNSTVVGCLLPFTFVWLRNARDHANLLQQSLFDPLTGLLNRRGLLEAAGRELHRYGRGHEDFAIAVADIDHFKKLNDRHGHAYGDQVLVSFSALCRSTLRQSDVVGRSGGEEFILLLPMTSTGDAKKVLERLRQSFAGPSADSTGEADERPTVSIGITHTQGRDHLTWDELLHEADSAMYEAKRNGRNRIVVHSGTVPVTTQETLG